MSLFFNATGTTARSLAGFNAFDGTITLMIWAYYLGAAEGGTAFLISPSVADGSAFGSSDSTTSTLVFARGFSVTAGQWFADTSFDHNLWQCPIVTYDDSSTANDPSFYIITPSTSALITSLGTTENVTPDGTALTTGEGINFGNSEVGSLQTFNGYLAHGQAWNRILSAGEIQQAAFFPGSVINGLVGWWPMYLAGSTLSYNNPGYCPIDGVKRNLLVQASATGIINPPVSPPFIPNFGQHNWISK